MTSGISLMPYWRKVTYVIAFEICIFASSLMFFWVQVKQYFIGAVNRIQWLSTLLPYFIRSSSLIWYFTCVNVKWFASLATFAFPIIHVVYPQIFICRIWASKYPSMDRFLNSFRLTGAYPRVLVWVSCCSSFTIPQCTSKVYRASPRARSIGSLSNDDSDGNEDVKKAIGFITQNNNFARA